MSASVARCAGGGIGLVIWCSGHGCRRGSVYVPPGEARERFGRFTCEQAQRQVYCDPKARGCGARGRDGRITVLPSTMDMADIRIGKPSGTSERHAIEQRAAAEQRQRQECAEKGWDWDAVYGVGLAWPRA